MKVRRVLRATISFAMALGLAVVVTACGSSSGESPGETAGAEGKRPTIAAVSLAGSEYNAAYNRGFEKAASQLGLEVSITNSPTIENSDMTATIDAAIATNPEYLIAPAFDSTALRQPLLTASERGIKVIVYDTQVSEPDFILTYVNANYLEYGELAGKELGSLVEGKGKVMLDAVFPGNQGLEEIEDGFAKTLPSSVTELPVQYSHAENSKANAIVRSMLTGEPELSGIAATSAFGGEGSIAALREAGETGKVKAVLLSATPFAISALRKGEAQVVVAEPLESIGERAVHAAYEDANGKSLPKEILLPLCTITVETIDAPENAPCIQKKE